MKSCPHCLSPYQADVEFCGIDGTKLIVSDTDPLIGKEIDRYRLVARIGDGAMARVYRATHKVLELEYAVKVLLGEMTSDKKLAERFRREAQVISKLSHPNIVQVVDFGSTKEGLTFLAMELLRGRTLRDAIKKDGPFAPERAASIARQIASGLAEAHARGFVHRDLKPGNVMLLSEGGKERAKILDFGLVRAPDGDEECGLLTKTGQFLGTPIYMAPEQIIGADVSHHADLYALGVVLFEMIEGKPPFRAKTLAEIRKKHLTEPPPPMRDAKGLEKLALALLHKEASGRPQSATEVMAKIDLLIEPGLGAPEITVKTEMPVPFLDAAPTEAIPLGPALAPALGPEAEPTARLPLHRPLSDLPELGASALVELAAELNADAQQDSASSSPALVTPVLSDHGEHERSVAPRLVSSLVAVPTDDVGSMFDAIGKRRWIAPAGVAAAVLALASVLVFGLAQNSDPADSQPIVVPTTPVLSAKQPDPVVEPTPVAVVAEVVEAIKDEPAVATVKLAKATPPKRAPHPTVTNAEAAPSYSAVQRRLDQLSAKLGQASSKLKETELRPFEDRYLALAGALSPHANESELTEVMKKANALARDLGKALER